MKTTLNPFENAKRTAQGTGGVYPSVIEEMQAEITVLGSQLEEVAVAYSTTEAKTGRKWIDGKPIYTRVINYTGPLDNTATTLASDIDYISDIINGVCVADNVAEGTSPIVLWLDGTNLKGRTAGNFATQLLHIVIEYTKTGA